jgi:vacuolar protein sorting-associated protein 13A/C
VDELQVAIAKVDLEGQEKGFGHVTLQRFALAFALAKFDMAVDVNLRWA